MKMKTQGSFRNRVFVVPAIMCALLFLMSVVDSFFAAHIPSGMLTASASTRYGILGQQAPELNLNNWINRDGKKTEPIKLRDYRGKVIYLYFFQDW